MEINKFIFKGEKVMSKILLDGEGVYRASKLIETIKDKKLKVIDYDTLLNIIIAIVLWDDIYIFHESMNSHYIDGIDYFKQYSSNFHTIKDYCHLPSDLEKMELDHFFEYCDGMKMSFDDLKPDENGNYKSEDVINALFGNKPHYNINYGGKRALDYLFIANINGFDYMPSIQRQAILESYDYTNFFIRKDVISKIDKELNRYYNQVNECLPIKRISYSFPVLLDYLLDKYCLEDIIKGAFELKQSNSLLEFRKEMDLLDKAWENGNIKNIEKYFKEIEHIIDVLSESIKCDKKFNLTISFPPALSFDIAVPHKKSFHSVFLKDLAFYGINERLPKPNLNAKYSLKK